MTVASRAAYARTPGARAASPRRTGSTRHAPSPRRALVVVGTRPEVIKLAPVVWAMADEGSFEPVVCVVGQQGDILSRAVEEWGIVPDVTLPLPGGDRRLAATLGTMLPLLADCIERVRPEVVIVEGDTTTSFAASLAAFYAGVAVAHVEAGLRTQDPLLPFPEEMHRRVVDRIATLHYAPTEGAQLNLAREGIDGGSVVVVGNTVVDALNAAIATAQPVVLAAAEHVPAPAKRTLLVTAHRRESFGRGIVRICTAIQRLVTGRSDLHVVYVLHSNPLARRPALEILSGLPGVELVEPQPYREFVRILGRAHIVLTDSGGVQEEAPYLGVPVLVTRPSTERPEAHELGGAWIVGTRVSRIVDAVHRLLDDADLHARMAQVRSPYGDGRASIRIVRHMAGSLATVPASPAMPAIPASPATQRPLAGSPEPAEPTEPPADVAAAVDETDTTRERPVPSRLPALVMEAMA